jgi:hypothetical protein
LPLSIIAVSSPIRIPTSGQLGGSVRRLPSIFALAGASHLYCRESGKRYASKAVVSKLGIAWVKESLPLR